MKFSVLALDFDGTIARADRLDNDVRDAIGELRSLGVVVVIVTGRILEDLRQVTGGLHFVDAVVAENGAVVEFPASGYQRTNGAAPSAAFLRALTQVGVQFDAGQVVVEASAADAHTILTVIRRLELPLTIAFNRSRLMVLPQTVSKATGLKQALAILRLSPRNALGIGDAENDHELLQVCEVGVAVAWGSDVLKGMADEVLPGDGPWAVAPYIRSLGSRRMLPVPTTTRRRLLLGHTDDGRPFELAVRGRNLLVAGDPKSGKSWVAGLLCEQLILHGYSLCVIDPEGDYTSLEVLPGVTVLGGADPLPRPRDMLRALRHADVSVVIDLSRVTHDARVEYVRTLLPALATLRRHTGLPHRIVVDEAHYFLNDAGISHLLDFHLNSYTLVSYRASHLHAGALAATTSIVVTRESDPHEVAALFDRCATCAGHRSLPQFSAMLEALTIGEAVVLPVTDEAHGSLTRVRLAPRLTPHVRHQAKYIDVPVAASNAFVLWHNGSPAGRHIRTLRNLVEVLESTPREALAGHLQRGDFSRWIADVFGDYPLAASSREIEARVRSESLDNAAEDLALVIRARYEFPKDEHRTS